MLSTLEKMIILKGASIFAEVPNATLMKIASMLEAVELTPGERLFAKGDHGAAMYLVVAGAVRIHDGEHTFTTLGEREVFGEMALLDGEVRSASATAVEETLLLRLEQEPFLLLLEEQVGLARGILKVLTQRLRARSQELVRG
jgi:CRP/FNR family cyclic AMP-dependent transcriptional regulator